MKTVRDKVIACEQAITKLEQNELRKANSDSSLAKEQEGL
jgi:hypothetical protein